MADLEQYAQRDHQAQGEHYLRHVSAMTSEGLHAKSVIAGELAHRDIEIARLTAERDALQAKLDAAAATVARATGDWPALSHKAVTPDEVFDKLAATSVSARKITPTQLAKHLKMGGTAKLYAAEPVAWMFDRATWHEGDIRGRGWHPDISRSKPYGSGMVRNVVPLAALPMECCPDAMTDEQRARWGKSHV